MIVSDEHEKKKNGDDDDGVEDSFDFFGALFEEEYPRTVKEYLWRYPRDDPSMQTVVVARALVRCIDDDPGAVQSGHYVWPASLVLCDHLVKENSNNDSRSDVNSILELGAGCGITSLVAHQVFAPTLELLVVTDHDYSVLKEAKGNFELTLSPNLSQQSSGTNNICARTGALGPLPTKTTVGFKRLDWGSSFFHPDWHHQLEQLCMPTHPGNKYDKNENETGKQNIQHPEKSLNVSGFDLILGSDLIDCVQVVEPLFRTIHAFLRKETNGSLKAESIGIVTGGRGETRIGDTPAICLLAQSFMYDEETEQEIQSVCSRFRLERRILVDTLSSSSSETGSSTSGIRSKIQEFICSEK